MRLWSCYLTKVPYGSADVGDLQSPCGWWYRCIVCPSPATVESAGKGNARVFECALGNCVNGSRKNEDDGIVQLD